MALVAIGLIYTVIALIGADLGSDVDVGGPDLDVHIGEFDVAGIHVPDVDIGVDAPEVDIGGGLQFPSISPFSVASFVTGFGGAGMFANLAFGVSAVRSLLWAGLGGLLLGGAMQIFFGAVLLKSQGSSEVRLARLRGRVAQVTVPIHQGTSGQVAFVVRGRRVTYAARAEGDHEIARGAQVEIIRIVGGSVIVRPRRGEQISAGG
jgi:membrane protein implicated in regulation of membrane protease activity